MSMREISPELMSKVLAGEATEQEKNEFEHILRESKESEKMYNRIREYWHAEVKHVSGRDGNEFVRQLMSRVQSASNEKIANNRRLYVRMASIAAAVFFVVASTFFYLYQTSTSGHLYTYSTQHEPVEYVLSDGTKVTLNKSSSITFREDYGKRNRNVQLEGEALFHVIKDEQKPFVVEALGTKTEVLGTTFNVKTAPGIVVTTLVEGSVRFRSDACNELLLPGEEITYKTTEHSYTKLAIDTQMNTAWASGRFSYYNLTFAQLAEKLERIYNVTIHIEDESVAERVITVSFLREDSIEELLKTLKDELDFSFSFTDTTHIHIVKQKG